MISIGEKMNIFHERFRNRKNRIGMYLVVASSAAFYLLLFDIHVPVWLLITAAFLFILGIILFILAEKE